MPKPVEDNMSDPDLVAASIAGDKTAFGVLALRHRRAAVGVCSRFLGDPDLAVETVQEAIVVALVQLERLRDPERFGSWLCGIALNLARQRVRHRRRLTEVPLEAVGSAYLWPDSGDDPAEAAQRADLQQRVRRAVAELAPGQREAVLLFYLEGRTHREVAADLAISVNAVKARLHQARAALASRVVRLASTATEPDSHHDTEVPAMADHTYVDMRVREVRRGPDEGSLVRRHVIVLEEPDGERRLPIWVGPAEATALAVDLANVEMPRPMTYTFIASLLAASGADLSEVRVTQLHEGTFYAVVVVETGEARSEVDARPSDALALAVVTDTPVRVETAVLDASARRHHDAWLDYDVATATIASEAEARRDLEQRRLAEEASP